MKQKFLKYTMIIQDLVIQNNFGIVFLVVSSPVSELVHLVDFTWIFTLETASVTSCLVSCTQSSIGKCSI